jgi:transposase
MGKRVKYNYEFRLQCVEAVLKGNRSAKKVATEKGFADSNLRLWVSFYKRYGKAGLRPRATRHYDTAFKLSVLQAIQKEHLSLRESCVKFNIPSESQVVKWQKAYRVKGLLGLTVQARGRPRKMKSPIKRKTRKSSKPLTREEELLKENEYLRAENALLKKLQALAQTKKKQKP